MSPISRCLLAGSLATLIPALLLPALLPAGAAAGESPQSPVPVARVDLERYAGRWFEIAKIPNRFQKQCVGGTTATYTLREDGKIEVVNRCRKRGGGMAEARGVAEIVDKETHAKLRVSFVSFLGFRPFWGDYWILALGENYEYALVGTPDRKYGWILSRTPALPTETIRGILDAIRTQGYDPDRFQASSQDSTSASS
jgi:apolipoprotein D and lipocalin family protein